jgi:hypothetical protein
MYHRLFLSLSLSFLFFSFSLSSIDLIGEKTETRWGRKTSERERETESILLCGSGNATWVERKKKKRKKRKKKGENPRNDGRNREGLFRRHTSDGRLCWEGRVEKGVSFLFLFLCAPLTSSFNPPQI